MIKYIKNNGYFPEIDSHGSLLRENIIEKFSLIPFFLEEKWNEFSPNDMNSGNYTDNSFIVSSDDDTISYQAWMLFSKGKKYDFGKFSSSLKKRGFSIELKKERNLGGIMFSVIECRHPFKIELFGSFDNDYWSKIGNPIQIGFKKDNIKFPDSFCFFNSDNKSGEMFSGNQNVLCRIENNTSYKFYRISFSSYSNEEYNLVMKDFALYETANTFCPLVCVPFEYDNTSVSGVFSSSKSIGVEYKPIDNNENNHRYCDFPSSLNSSVTYSRLFPCGMKYYTISFFCIFNNDSPSGTIISKGSGFYMSVSKKENSTLEFKICSGENNEDYFAFTKDYDYKAWHHYAFSSGENNDIFYIDGKEVFKRPHSGSPFLDDCEDDFNIGCMTINSSGRNDFMNGFGIRHFSVYDYGADESVINTEIRKYK